MSYNEIILEEAEFGIYLMMTNVMMKICEVIINCSEKNTDIDDFNGFEIKYFG